MGHLSSQGDPTRLPKGSQGGFTSWDFTCMSSPDFVVFLKKFMLEAGMGLGTWVMVPESCGWVAKWSGMHTPWASH